MAGAFKSYKALTSRRYRIVGIVIYPLVMLAFTGFMMSGGSEYNGIYPENFLYSYVIVGEVVLDGWLFGGICCRDCDGLEYIRTSKRGPGVIAGSLAVDMLRRFVYFMLMGGVCFTFTGMPGEFVTAALAYTAATVVLNLTRHYVVWQLNLLCGMGAAVLFAVSQLVSVILGNELSKSAGAAAAMPAVAFVPVVLVSAATAWHMSWCLKRSYYEKESL